MSTRLDFDPSMFTSEELWALNRNDVRPPRSVRKTIFSLQLWRPTRQRSHSQRCFLRRGDPGRLPRTTTDGGLAIGCVNARSVSNKAAMLSYVIADERLDAVVITETWHEGPDSSSLWRLTPPGYRFIEAARPIPPGRQHRRLSEPRWLGACSLHRSQVTEKVTGHRHHYVRIPLRLMD